MTLPANQNLHSTATDLEKSLMQVPANPTDSSTDFQSLPRIGSPTNLVNGGAAILAIIALTYFSKTLIESIAKLLEVWNKKK